MRNSSTIPLLIMLVWLPLLLYGANAAADGGDDFSDSETPPPADYQSAKEAMERGDYETALSHLQRAGEAAPDNADIENLLGFAYRKLDQTEQAFRHYHRALELDPEHRGAHEYIGELYLEQGQLQQAKQHLAELDRICFWSCEPYRELRDAVAQYEADNGIK